MRRGGGGGAATVYRSFLHNLSSSIKVYTHPTPHIKCGDRRLSMQDKAASRVSNAAVQQTETLI